MNDRTPPPFAFGVPSVLLLAIVVLTAVFTVVSADAADKFEKEDAVEVFFLNKWWPGTVVQTNARGEVLAEYEFAGRKQQRVFKKAEVRFAYESGALARSRTWKDASGEFRIKAAVISIQGDTITLRQPDMTEIPVPINKLSAVDQSFVKRLQKELGPTQAPASPLPPVEKFATGNSSSPGAFGAGGERNALTADPLPEFVQISQGGVGFPLRDFFDELVAVLPVGGSDSWVLAAVASKKPNEPPPSRLLWISLENEKVEREQDLAPGEVVLDYHSPSRRLLTYGTVKSDDAWGTPVLTLWEVIPTDKEPKPVVRWHADLDSQQRHAPWARIVNGNTVVQRASNDAFVGWDVANKKLAYRITQESFFHPAPTLSGGRKYLFMPEDKAVRIYQAADGKLVSTLPAEEGASAVAVTADGRRAAVLGRNRLTVWELTDPQSQPEVHKSAAIGTPFGTTLAWVDAQHVMADVGGRGQVLYRLKDDLALWNYQFDTSAVRNESGQRVRDIVDGHLVYAASVLAGSDRGFAVGALQLPGPRVEEVAAALDRESLMILKPGSAVRLEVQAGENNPRVQQALASEIKNNGWQLTPNASAAVIAEMKRGETQQVTYRFGIGSSASEQSVTVTPYISTVRIEVDGKVAWQSGTRSGAPGVVSLKPGEQVQDEVNRWQKPNVEFFETVDIPDQIMDPGKRKGLGVTKVTTRGFEVQ